MQISLFFKLAAVSIRSEMQHRASFFMMAISYFLSTFVDIVGIWVLFDRFRLVKGWSIEQVAIIYGVVHMGFSLAEAFARGFDSFSEMVKKGDFDRVLLRPASTLVQIASREIQLMRIGRFLQGMIVLGWGFCALQIKLVSWDAFVIVFSVAGTASLFYGLFVLQGALSFWTTETLELVNIATYGGLEAGQYPMSVYHPLFRRIFTFIIPLSCVAYLPIASTLGQHPLPIWLGSVLPMAGFLFFLVSLSFWERGVKRYCSTGS